jgi:hypothetical protein
MLIASHASLQQHREVAAVMATYGMFLAGILVLGAAGAQFISTEQSAFRRRAVCQSDDQQSSPDLPTAWFAPALFIAPTVPGAAGC